MGIILDGETQVNHTGVHQCKEKCKNRKRLHLSTSLLAETDTFERLNMGICDLILVTNHRLSVDIKAPRPNSDYNDKASENRDEFPGWKFTFKIKNHVAKAGRVTQSFDNLG